MHFYTQQHNQYCGIDLYARTMSVCILDQHGTKLVHKNLPTTPEAFWRVITPYREDIVVAVECLFTWYWLADLCATEGIAFVLGHALSPRLPPGPRPFDFVPNRKQAAIRCHGLVKQRHFNPFPFWDHAEANTSGNC